MTLRFTNLREPVSAAALTPIERKQLRLAGRLYDDKDLPAEKRFPTGRPDEAQSDRCFGGYLELWDVFLMNGEQHRYDAYLYAVDSGTIFRHGTVDVVAQVIQSHFDAEGNPALARALQAAYKAAQKAQRAARTARLAKIGEAAGKKTSGVAAKKTTKVAGKKATKVAGKKASKVAGRKASKVAGKKVSKVAGKKASKVAGKKASKVAGKKASKVAGKKTSKVAAKKTTTVAAKKTSKVAGK